MKYNHSHVLLMRMDHNYAVWIKIGANIGLQATIKNDKE